MSTDGRWLVVREQPPDGGPGGVQLWDVRASPPKRVALGHDEAVVRAEVDLQGEFLALWTAAPERLLVWHLPAQSDTEAAATSAAPSLVLDYAATGVRRWSFSPAGSTFCAVAGTDVTVWRLGPRAVDVTCETVVETAPVADCRVSRPATRC